MGGCGRGESLGLVREREGDALAMQADLKKLLLLLLDSTADSRCGVVSEKRRQAPFLTPSHGDASINRRGLCFLLFLSH